MKCPACRGVFEAVRGSGVQTYACRSCRGRALTIPILKRYAPSEEVIGLWRMSVERECLTHRECPVCQRSMIAFVADLPDKPIEMNACRRCQLFFFDAGQLGPVPRDLQQCTGTLSPSAKRAYDVARGNALKQRLRTAAAEHDQVRDPGIVWWARDVLHFFV
jgi:Zn-finger nucleic acid-binding protein